MTKPVPPTDDSTNGLSGQIARHFGATVDPVLAQWWDDEIWRCGGGNEFRWPVPPQDWFSGRLDSLWPALMPCHFMPLIGNDAGDFLCVRVDDDGRFGQIVHWYHGGGDWIPWGDNLAEALAVDAFAASLPGISNRHAESASLHRSVSPSSNAWLDWIGSHVDLDGIDERNAAEAFDQRGIGRIATLAGRLVAHRIAIADDQRGIDPRFGDDAEVAALATRLAPSLAWTWDAAGRAAEATGRIDEATEHYLRGARCSVFTSQSVRLGTHQSEAETPKFSIARLQVIAPEKVRDDDYFRRLTFKDREQRQKSVQSYWHQIAACQDDGSRPQLFALHMAAWDVGLWSMDAYRDAIACIAEAAEIGSMTARSRVARLHLDTLVNRGG